MMASGGVKGKSGSRNGVAQKVEQRVEELNPEESQMWSEDPSVYQALADPARKEKMIDTMLEEEWYDTEEEIQELVDVANKIRDLAETQTVTGVTTLYRGESFKSLAAAQAKYKVGAEISNTQLTSYATDKSVAQSYASMYGTTAVVIKNVSKNGDFVGLRTQHYGEKPGEGVEVITPKNLTSKVVATRYDKATNTLFVDMENFETPKKTKKK